MTFSPRLAGAVHLAEGENQHEETVILSESTPRNNLNKPESTTRALSAIGGSVACPNLADSENLRSTEVAFEPSQEQRGKTGEAEEERTRFGHGNEKLIGSQGVVADTELVYVSAPRAAFSPDCSVSGDVGAGEEVRALPARRQSPIVEEGAI